MWNPNSVYRHYNAEGTLLYVGCSINPFMRLRSHEIGLVWAADIVRVEIERFPSSDAALDAECLAIRNEGPRFNKSDLRWRPRKTPTKARFKYNPDPPAARRHHAVWINGDRSEIDRLATIAADNGSLVTRQTLNGRYGNPTRPKPAPE